LSLIMQPAGQIIFRNDNNTSLYQEAGVGSLY
jgi:hypothetical protein